MSTETFDIHITTPKFADPVISEKARQLINKLIYDARYNYPYSTYTDLLRYIEELEKGY